MQVVNKWQLQWEHQFGFNYYMYADEKDVFACGNILTADPYLLDQCLIIHYMRPALKFSGVGR